MENGLYPVRIPERITIQLKKDSPVRRRDLDCAERIVSRHIVRDVIEGKLQQLRNAPIPNSFRGISENCVVGRSGYRLRHKQPDWTTMFQVPAVAFRKRVS